MAARNLALPDVDVEKSAASLKSSVDPYPVRPTSLLLDSGHLQCSQ